MKPLNNKEKPSSRNLRLLQHGIPEGIKKVIRWTASIPHVFWLVSTAVLLLVFLGIMPRDLWQYFGARLSARGDLVALVLVFSLVSLSLLWSFGQQIDARLFMYFNRYARRTPMSDWAMLGITQAGNGLFAMIVALLFYLSAHRLLAYALVLGTLTLWFVVELMKILVHRTRPFIKLKDVRTVGALAAGRSFPSGHTSQSFFLGTFLGQYLQVNAAGWVLLYAVSLSVGVTRIYLGMHYPRDVVGGAMLGMGWGVLGVIMSSYFLTLP